MKIKSIPTVFHIMALLFYYPCHSQSIKKITLNESDFYTGSYLVVEPKNDTIDGVLVLIAGFGQRADDIFPESKLDSVSQENKILTIGFAAGNKLYADSITQARLSAVLKDVISRYKINSQKFVLGGFSAGGMIALRYVELCNQYPDKFPIQPKGVFTVDSLIDIFTIWDNLELSAKTRYSEAAVEEAERAMMHIRNDYGIPRENISKYAEINAFNMNIEYGEPEKHLRNTAVRVYHDVDIPWRLINRNQTVHNSNYEVTAELINRLTLMGNKRAEFMQSYKTGYRANGQRHPHSWSIVDEVEFIQWMKELIK
jgi:dienelactone hydrolase